jgi:hypothetical protein
MKGVSFAASSDTSYFQGKIVIKSSGTNISENNPSCVVNNSADSCDFKVGYYSASTNGTLLWQEDFLNVELGDYNGIFALALGTGSNGSGSENSYKEIFKNNSDVYMQISFDTDGNGDFTNPETFTTVSGDRMQIRGVPYAISAEFLSSQNNQFIKNQASQQASSNFNIDGSGTIAGVLTVGSNNSLYVNGTTNKVGIGTNDPLGFFSVGATSQFQIDSSGAITSATGIASSGNIKFTGLLGGLLKTDNTGLLSLAQGGTDYENPLTFSGPLTRNVNTIGLTQAGISSDGYLSSSDWNKFTNSANLASITKEPTGFPNRTSSSIGFNDSNRNFTITGTDFEIYIRGQKFIKNTESIEVPDSVGIHFVYYNSSGDLTVSSTAWTFEDVVQVATIYWNGTAGLLGDERHGLVMDPMTHEYLHKTVGTRYDTGLAGTFGNSTFSITAGSIYDEDIKISISQETTARVLYKETGGASFTFTNEQSAYYKTTVGGVVQWDSNGTPTAVTNNSHVAYWIFATNDQTTPIYSLMGQREDAKISDARANNTYESLSLANLPFAEMKLLYRVILKNQGGTPTQIETQDMRTITNLSSGTYVASSHSTLTSLLNDDHTQYALLAGRSGGQVLTGSVDTDSGLTLKSTSGVGSTGADIVFQTGNNGATEAMRILNNGRVGIGTNNPGQVLDVNGRIRMQNWTADGTTAVYKNADGDIGLQSSDQRLKKNVVEMQNSLDIINAIRTVKFNWLNEEDDSKQTIGVIAQDLLTILPEAVFNFTDPNDGNTYYGVHYEKLGVLALDGIKGLSTELNDIKTEIGAFQQISTGEMWTINNDGKIYTTKDIILNNVSAIGAKINSIDTSKINAINIDVSGVLTTEKIFTKLIEARKDENIALKLSERMGLTGFNILDSDGNKIFGVNSLGDVDINGKLNILSEGNRRSSGTDNIPAYEVLVRVSSEAITEKSKVFLSITDNTEVFPVLKVSKTQTGFFEVILIL